MKNLENEKKKKNTKRLINNSSNNSNKLSPPLALLRIPIISYFLYWHKEIQKKKDGEVAFFPWDTPESARNNNNNKWKKPTETMKRSETYAASWEEGVSEKKK